MPRLVRRNCRVILLSLAIVTVLHITTVGSDTRPVEQRYPPRPHHEYLHVKQGNDFDDHIISDLLVNNHKPSSSSTTKNTTTTTTTTKSTTQKPFRAVAVVAKKKVTTTKKASGGAHLFILYCIR